MNPSTQSGPGVGYHLSSGDRVGGGHYILKRLLGRGQFSEVWLAQDIRDIKPVALKFLPPAFLSDANLVERLRQDTRRFQLLKHPHIINTYEFFSEFSALAIASEFVDGWSLATLKVDHPGNCYSVAEIETWIYQLCDALAYAHNELGIIHSDLKPANLLITAKEELKITDFEIANVVRQESSRRGLSKGLYAGLGFLSPQQVMGEPPTKLDDIYSLGATIFDLLTGTAPFYKGEIFAQICSLKAPTVTARLKELNLQGAAVPLVWEDTIARCLEKKPADRPQSVGEVLELLKRTQLAKPLPSAPVTPPPAPPVLPVPPAPSANPEPPAPSAPTVPPVPASTDQPPIVPPLSPPPVVAVRPATPPTQPSSAKTVIILFVIVLFALALIAGTAVFLALRHSAATLSHAVTNALTNGITAATTVANSANSGVPGSVDPAFAIGDGPNDQVHAIAVQPDGKILIGGKFATVNGASHHGIARLNPDGTLDTSFNHDTVGLVQSIAVQPDGKILIAGGTMLKGHPGTRIVRLNPNGSADRSFKSGLKINSEVRTIGLQPDGQILAAGNFTSLGGKSQNRLVRLASNAALDDDFDANIAFPSALFALALQPDGKVLVGGTFTTIGETKAGHIVRLNPNGSLDLEFHSGAGADNNVIAIALQSDGSILIGGNFTAVNHRASPHLARLNPDGTVDVSFNVGSGPEKSVQAIAVQPDGKILIAGDFSFYQNQTCPRIARLNPDGSLDKSFNPGSGASGMIETMTLQPDGKILIGGDFTSYDSANHPHLARLNNPTPAQ